MGWHLLGPSPTPPALPEAEEGVRESLQGLKSGGLTWVQKVSSAPWTRCFSLQGTPPLTPVPLPSLRGSGPLSQQGLGLLTFECDLQPQARAEMAKAWPVKDLLLSFYKHTGQGTSDGCLV